MLGISNNYMDLEFYLLENKHYKEIILKLIEIIGYIKPEKFYFGYYYEEKLSEFLKEKLKDALEEEWTGYEDYFFTIRGAGSQFFNLRISPFLKEVSTVKIRIHKSVFEKNKQNILAICDYISESDSMMYGFADASVSNPYFYKGYGQIKFGAHWLTWYGQWSLQ